jgi:hypothetical protein
MIDIPPLIKELRDPMGFSLRDCRAMAKAADALESMTQPGAEGEAADVIQELQDGIGEIDETVHKDNYSLYVQLHDAMAGAIALIEKQERDSIKDASHIGDLREELNTCDTRIAELESPE